MYSAVFFLNVTEVIGLFIVFTTSFIVPNDTFFALSNSILALIKTFIFSFSSAHCTNDLYSIQGALNVAASFSDDSPLHPLTYDIVLNLQQLIAWIELFVLSYFHLLLNHCRISYMSSISLYQSVIIVF